MKMLGTGGGFKRKRDPNSVRGVDTYFWCDEPFARRAQSPNRPFANAILYVAVSLYCQTKLHHMPTIESLFCSPCYNSIKDNSVEYHCAKKIKDAADGFTKIPPTRGNTRNEACSAAVSLVCEQGFMIWRTQILNMFSPRSSSGTCFVGNFLINELNLERGTTDFRVYFFSKALSAHASFLKQIDEGASPLLHASSLQRQLFKFNRDHYNALQNSEVPTGRFGLDGRQVMRKAVLAE